MDSALSFYIFPESKLIERKFFENNVQNFWFLLCCDWVRSLLLSPILWNVWNNVKNQHSQRVQPKNQKWVSEGELANFFSALTLVKFWSDCYEQIVLLYATLGVYSNKFTLPFSRDKVYLCLKYDCFFKLNSYSSDLRLFTGRTIYK